MVPSPSARVTPENAMTVTAVTAGAGLLEGDVAGERLARDGERDAVTGHPQVRPGREDHRDGARRRR